jgi:hypothetical protein
MYGDRSSKNTQVYNFGAVIPHTILNNNMAAALNNIFSQPGFDP